MGHRNEVALAPYELAKLDQDLPPDSPSSMTDRTEAKTPFRLDVMDASCFMSMKV